MTPGRDDKGSSDGTPEALLKPGDVIGGYPIGKLIGRGGQSEIYEGEDRPNRCRVAIKVLLFKHQINPTMRKRAKLEAEAEMLLNHPNIVKVYSAGVDESTTGADGRKRNLFYIVMEFLDGETLDDLIHRKGRLDVRETLHIAAEVLDGLAMLHLTRIIHRDIKPENIFLTSDGRVVLIDLGIAKLDEKDFSAIRTDANILMGTFAYMSPEQIDHKRAVDHRTDLYALGIVTFKCLAGVHPGWNHHEHPQPPDAREYAAWHLTTVPPLVSELRPDVPENVAGLVARAVEKNPDRRPASAAEYGALTRELIEWVDKNPAPMRAPLAKRPVLRPDRLSLSEFWKPLGAATTQEDEGNDGPTPEAKVPMRLHGPVAATLLSPPPREPTRTTTFGTDIMERSAVLGLIEAPVAPPTAPPSRSPPQDMEKTQTGTEIVPRDAIVPQPVPGARPAPEPPRFFAPPPRAPQASFPGPATEAVTAEPETKHDLPLHGPGSTAPVLAAAAAEKPRTTSAHLVSLPPPAARRPPPRAAWLLAAMFAGLLCGAGVLLFFRVRAPIPSVAQASAEPVSLPAAPVAPADAGTPDAEPPDAGPAAVDPPDASAAAAAEPKPWTPPKPKTPVATASASAAAAPAKKPFDWCGLPFCPDDDDDPPLFPSPIKPTAAPGASARPAAGASPTAPPVAPTKPKPKPLNPSHKKKTNDCPPGSPLYCEP